MELVDLIIVTKADGDLMGEVRRLKTEWSSALRLMRRRSPTWSPKVISPFVSSSLSLSLSALTISQVLSVSARTNTDIDKAWAQMFAFQTAMSDSGELLTKRAQQLRKWMWNNVRDRLLDQFLTDGNIQKAIEYYEERVTRGLITPFVAADAILDLFAKGRTDASHKY